MGLRDLKFDFEGVSFEFEVDERERIISENVLSTGGWEQNQLRLYAELVPAAGVFVDVGANVGVNSIYLSKLRPAARAIAIEASHENFEVLRQNVSSNDVPIEIFHMAIADSCGEVDFSGSGTNAKIAHEGGGTEKVACTTLDEFVEALSLEKIHLMKVDVEGFTDLVFSKSDAALSRTDSLIVEFSCGDVELRFGDQVDVVGHFEQLLAVMGRHFEHFYYISRHDGLVRLPDTEELYYLLATEGSVGDVLATKRPMARSISSGIYMLKIIHELQKENHRRVEDYLGLTRTLAEKSRPSWPDRLQWFKR